MRGSTICSIPATRRRSTDPAFHARECWGYGRRRSRTLGRWSRLGLDSKTGARHMRSVGSRRPARNGGASQNGMIPQREIQARLVRYAATKDGRDLWPEVSPAAFRAAQEEIARVARAVLTDAGRPVDFEVPPGTDTRACGVAACAAG